MNREHKEIGRLTDELEQVRREIVTSGFDAAHERRLAELLRRLRQVIEQHFEEEQEACFSILQTELGPDEARDLFAAMERATGEIRSLYE
jgi:hemerythrin-like domain-containing protein